MNRWCCPWCGKDISFFNTFITGNNGLTCQSCGNKYKLHRPYKLNKLAISAIAIVLIGGSKVLIALRLRSLFLPYFFLLIAAAVLFTLYDFFYATFVRQKDGKVLPYEIQYGITAEVFSHKTMKKVIRNNSVLKSVFDIEDDKKEYLIVLKNVRHISSRKSICGMGFLDADSYNTDLCEDTCFTIHYNNKEVGTGYIIKKYAAKANV